MIERSPPTAKELASMYQNADWISEPDLGQMTLAVNSSSEWFVARDTNKEIVGIGRFITDYARYAFVVDVIVKESNRGQGIGSEIMLGIISECRRLGIASVNLWPSVGKVPFYERLGFYTLSSDQPHMKLRDEND